VKRRKPAGGGQAKKGQLGSASKSKSEWQSRECALVQPLKVDHLLHLPKRFNDWLPPWTTSRPSSPIVDLIVVDTRAEFSCAAVPSTMAKTKWIFGAQNPQTPQDILKPPPVPILASADNKKFGLENVCSVSTCCYIADFWF
jgi:hypothetical protein